MDQQTTQGLATEQSSTVRVALGDRAYDIVIGPGLLGGVGRRLAEIAPGTRAAIITDETVAGLHLDAVEASLKDQIGLAGTIVLPPGESTKSFAQLEPLCEQLLEMEVERRDTVIALGGGVIGDLAGFAASLIRRGVRLVQVPTTLLAQVDSAVGGKTGIDTPQGKNLVGTFYQPSLVVADADVLETLPDRQFRAGYAEVAKYGLLGDASFFDWLDRNWKDIFAGPGPARSEAIEKSCIMKANIVAEDEREAGQRALLNLGHTFGHAIEAFAGYSHRLLHGEGVSIGMTLAFGFSEELALCSKQDCERMEAHLKSVGLPTRIVEMEAPHPTAKDLLALMAQDKKVEGGNISFVLVRGIGHAYVEREVPMGRLEDFLTRKCEGR